MNIHVYYFTVHVYVSLKSAVSLYYNDLALRIHVVFISILYFVRRYILFLYNMQVSIVLMFYLFSPTLSVYSVCSQCLYSIFGYIIFTFVTCEKRFEVTILQIIKVATNETATLH